MSKVNYNQDEIKHKLRALKRLEIKVRSMGYDLQNNNKRSLREYEKTKRINSELVWSKYFDLKEESTKNVKYSMKKLSVMTKDEFKDVINEYLYYVYYCCYKENEFADDSKIDEKILTELGLPLYADHIEIKRKLRELAKIYHPDNGGDSAKFIELMEKYKARDK